MKTLRFVLLAALLSIFCQSCFADPFVDPFPRRTYEFLTDYQGYGMYFQFDEPTYLSVTTTIVPSALHPQITLSDKAHDLTLSYFIIVDPLSNNPSIQYGFSDGTEITIGNWSGPFGPRGSHQLDNEATLGIVPDSPEPATLILLSSGLLGLGGAVRKKWIA